jgi:hypothetical protein
LRIERPICENGTWYGKFSFQALKSPRVHVGASLLALFIFLIDIPVYDDDVVVSLPNTELLVISFREMVESRIEAGDIDSIDHVNLEKLLDTLRGAITVATRTIKQQQRSGESPQSQAVSAAMMSQNASLERSTLTEDTMPDPNSGSLSKNLTITPYQILETHDPSHSPAAMHLAQSVYQDGIHATHFPQNDFTPYIPGNAFIDTPLESLQLAEFDSEYNFMYDFHMQNTSSDILDPVSGGDSSPSRRNYVDILPPGAELSEEGGREGV